jgi:hypothetical protein
MSTKNDLLTMTVTSDEVNSGISIIFLLRTCQRILCQDISDVNSGEKWWQNPFNSAYYYLYRSIADGGICFGMCLESINSTGRCSLFMSQYGIV